ncbi:MAG: hypothetical protein RMM29_00245 [Planctomycetota bacterium]|nr:hypothetical protein [Planctomycetota bacterium]MCX8039299.1 hypothetical protein [Planctomycetota bacterium]MDW8372064.1 hypothetical protein [Planctomycetota bacterium]
MLSDKIYLWMVIISCIALIVAGIFCVVELSELSAPNAATSGNLFAS